MNRPRLTIAVLRGLLHMNHYALAEIQDMSDEERRAALGATGDRDWDRAAQWLVNMRHWYMSKEEQS